MKRILLFPFILFLLIPGTLTGQQNKQGSLPGKETALLLIDIQEFYFEGGQMPLENPVKAGKKAGSLLKLFRQKKMKVIHIRHNASSNASIHSSVQPTEGEKVFTKNRANSFLGTGLGDYLEQQNISHLVIAGMMTHMCVEATTRAASDKGYQCLVAADACATRDVQYRGRTIPARHIHLSTLATLQKSYGKVMKTEELIELIDQPEP
jgi:nicotinamidase-related amidase